MHDKTIVIGADVVPTKTNEKFFKDGDAEHLLGKELLDILDAADFTILNLETPLTDTVSEIRKCGPCLRASSDTIYGLKRINSHLYTLANNHILDQDVQGLFSTMQCLEGHDIAYAGVGASLEEASKPYIVELGGVSIGVYCCTEHEFSIVTENRAGANPYDPLYSFDHVRELKSKVDLVIVLYHGGKEHYRYPSPELRRTFRKFAECGADYVIAQHTHCIGCMEQYLENTLIYGQGNFLFDHSESEFWKTSLLLKININEDKTHSIQILPLVKKGECVRLAAGDVKKEIYDEFKHRSEQIREPGFIENQYRKFAEEYLPEYLGTFSGIKRSLLHRVINKLSGYRYEKWQMNRKYDSDKLVGIEDFIECEAHRELLLEGIRRSVEK